MTVEPKYICPISHESMAADAMSLEPCNHHFSESGIEGYFQSMSIIFEIGENFKRQLEDTQVNCPLCKTRITNVLPDHEHRQVLQELEKFSQPSENSDSKTMPAVVEQDIEFVIDDKKKTKKKVKANMSKPPKQSAPKPSYSSYDSVHGDNNLNDKHFGLHCLSYQAMADDTAKELAAFEEENYGACFSYGLLSRVRKAAGCCILTPVTLLQSIACCANAALCCGCGCLGGIVAADNHNVRYKEDEEFAGQCCKSFVGSAGYTAGTCGEFWMQILCCLPNMCLPEVVDKCTVPAQENIEKLERKSWKQIGKLCD